MVAAFTGSGAAQFFDEPLHEWFRGVVALDDVCSRVEFRDLEDASPKPRSSEARIALVDGFLCRRASRSRAGRHGRCCGSSDPPRRGRAPHRRAAGSSVSAKIRSKALPPRGSALHRSSSPTSCAFGGWFRATRGVNLRPCSRLTRGYCDQSHLVREFRAVTGEGARALPEGAYALLSGSAELSRRHASDDQVPDHAHSGHLPKRAVGHEEELGNGPIARRFTERGASFSGTRP